ncbi:MAPEG family protein [Phenylobacterium sp. J367]|uniref:MAPEG family protein n=1 Tax=Phenylobacterium sp. J367 TaxID=2898435 RepID=UPI0021507796|nr:MAPEG family protein [Phenylobacterium sp. J367]MCR5878216.1 MAPEG family protein [Phenylobacterium sp. J367]
MTALQTALVTPFLLHFALVLALYAALTVARAAAVRSGQVAYDAFARVDGDPPAAARIARNLGNQFEAPLFAYFAVLFLLWRGEVNAFDVAAAWLFLAGRVIHSAVQTLTDNVRLRGMVFTLNFLGVLALMAHVAWVVLGW